MKDPGPRPAPERRFTLVHLMLLIVGCALIFRVVSITGPAFLIVVVMLIPVFLVASAVAMAARRETQQDALLWVLAIAAQKRLPLAPGIYAVADQYGGRYRRQVFALANWLSTGVSLPVALDRVPGVLPRAAVTLIRVGWEAGALEPALREAAAARATRVRAQHPLTAKLGYLVGMLIALQVIGGFIMYFIVPKYEAIFADFGLRLPEITIYVIGLGHALAESFAMPLIALAELALLAYLPLYYFGWVRVRIPFITRLSRRRHTVLILRSLAVVAEAGRPLSDGVATLALTYPDPGVRRRLARVGRGIAEGANWWDCLHWNRLIRPSEAAVLESAQRAGNVPWALRELAEGGERRLDLRRQALIQLLFPLLVISLAGLVFLMAAAYFTPIVTLIQELAE